MMQTAAFRPILADAGGFATAETVRRNWVRVREAQENVFSLPQPDVLAQCYWYNERREVDLAIDSALDSFDRLLRGGQFRAADAVLRAVDVNYLHPDVSVAILVFTRAAAERLTNRERLIDRLRPILEGAEGPETARRILEQVR